MHLELSLRQKFKELVLEKTGIDINDECYSKHFFTKEYERIFIKDLTDQLKDHLLYFHYFLNQLEKIKNHSTKDFNDYLEKLSVDGVNLAGEKFEIFTYARLLDKSISFLKPKKKPDFEIKLTKSINNSIFVECGTRSTDKKDFFIKSVQQAITKKQNTGVIQGYANQDTALHVEISKTVFNSQGNPDSLDAKMLEQILNEEIKNTSFGAVVLITTFYSFEDGQVYAHPIIKYNNNFNKDLKKLHEAMFNLELKRVTPILRRYI